MFGKVKIGNQEFEMVANAATAYRFKQVFNKDLLKFFTQAARGEDVDADYVQMLAFIMIKQSEKADFAKVNEEMYVVWLEDFTQFDLLAAVNDIIDLYQKTEKTSSKAKNPDTQQKED